MTYVFYVDGGHGWLRVPLAELVELGIADAISPFSFMRGPWAFLEEDDNCPTYLDAKTRGGDRDAFWKEHVVFREVRGFSPIRRYREYNPERARTVAREHEQKETRVAV